MRILLVEDDSYQVDAVHSSLMQAGYVVDVASDGREALFSLRELKYDAVILDLGLPYKSGTEVLSCIRKEGNETPVLILTARDTWQDKVDGLKAGADDYLAKPFHTEELLARLEAVIRRYHGVSSQVIRMAGIALDLDRQVLTNTSGKDYQLTGIEFRLLRYLMLNTGKIISKSQLSEHVYEEDQLRDSNVIEVYINRLRQRLGKDMIETHRGQGYQLKG